LQVKPGSLAWPHRQGFIAATSWKPRRIDDAVVRPGDRDFPGFERLPQAVQNLRLEFRQFLEKQNAMVGEGNFPGPRPRAAANERRHRGRMMRRAERAFYR
jgi:hypothetical protein